LWRWFCFHATGGILGYQFRTKTPEGDHAGETLGRGTNEINEDLVKHVATLIIDYLDLLQIQRVHMKRGNI